MAEERMNLAALQQRDPYISEIIDTASQVALYLFNSKTNVWEKLSIAGSLFIYKRSASPENGFMILNRLGLNNLVEPITKYLEFQRQDSFLLYRNIKEQVIYGVWFYEQEECKRFEQQLTRYVQLVIEKKKVSPTPSHLPEVKKEVITTDLGMGAAAQVDIMQMLSKAHQEYNTLGPSDVKKKPEPKPMIDNPNASATKKSNIIRPMPLKMPDTDQIEDEGNTAGTTTPSTAPINLDALFRTASLQQEVSGSPRSILHRQTSVPAGSKGKGDYSDYPSESKQSVQEGLPPLLKQIMSTGSMVEDIERQHMDDPEKPDPDIGGESLHVGMPDVSQPPPGHPAYRGPSPREKTSPRGSGGGGGRKVKGRKKGGKDDQSMDMLSKDPVKFSVPGQAVSPQIVPGNLLPELFKLSSSHSSHIQGEQSISSQSHLGGKISPRVAVQEVKDKPEPLLTPADLIQSSSNVPTTSSINVQAAGTKPLSTSLASTVGPTLGTELLSPMAFITGTTRKTPPALVQERSVPEERTKESDPLPIAPLTKEQLQQAMLHLIKNDSGFVSQLHEAYLKSLQELSGHKT